MDKQKRVLLLGGARQQIPSILKAKEMGCYTITCDYMPENPGHCLADEYHNESTTDKEAILKLAQKLNIDGIVCYASDPAAVTAAYVASKLGLPTNPYEAVEILTNKDLFRAFLAEHGFHTPFAKGYMLAADFLKETGLFHFPVMVKPVDSSGSKGISLITKPEEIEDKVRYALEFSRNKRFVIEEYVEKYGYQIAGDGFSVDGRLVFRCFGNDHFDKNAINPYVPMAASFPYVMPKRVHDKIHAEIQRLFDLLHMNSGAYNFDIRIDENENVYLMEVGPRNGGNYIPQVTKYITGVDMVEYTIKAALGEDLGMLSMADTVGYWSYFAVYSHHGGILRAIEIKDEVRKNNIKESFMNYEPGEQVPAYTGSNGTIGILIMHFDSQEEMLNRMDHPEEWIKVQTL